MDAGRTLWYVLPQPLRRFPADLAVVDLLAVATTATVLLPAAGLPPLRVALGFTLALFLPGYGFVAALFPAGREGGSADAMDRSETTRLPRPGEGLGGVGRVVLSFGLSLALTPLVGLALNFTPWGIRLIPLVLSLSGFVVVTSAVAARRRWELPADERFSVPVRSRLAAEFGALRHPETRLNAALNVVFVLSLLLAVGGAGWALSAPSGGASFTDLSLLTQRDNGTLVAGGYPTEFVRGRGQPLVVGIGNHGHESTSYTVVVELQRMRAENGSTRVRTERTLQTLHATVAAGETWRQRITVTPPVAGTHLRLVFLLYEGAVPTDPSTANAVQETHLWINVTKPAGA